jgi:hypothetical protein
LSTLLKTVCLLALAGDEQQAGSVDPWVVAARALEDLGIQRRRRAGLPLPLRPLRREGDVLREPGPERLHVLVVDAGQAVIVEPPQSLTGRAGPREREYRTVA